MKKSIFTLLFFVFGLFAFSQTVTDHPLKKINKPVQAMEFVVVHTDNSGNGSSPTKVTLGHYERTANLQANQRIVQDHSYTNTSNYNTTGSHSVNVLTVDMNGDGYDEIVTAREKAPYVLITMPRVQRNPLSTLADGPGESINIGTVPSGASPQIKMAAGDFRRTGKNYFAVATPDYSVKKISVDVFFYDSLAGYPTFCGHIYADSLYYDGNNKPVGNFDIAIDDFDGDSIPDIAFAGLEKDGAGGYRCYVKTIKVIPSATDGYLTWTLTAVGKQTITAVGSNSSLQNLAISSGVYDSTAAPRSQIAVAVAYVDRNDNTLLHRKLFVASTGSGAGGLNTITVSASNFVSDQSNFNNFPAISMVSGDLNSDANEEIVLAFDNAVQVYSVGNGMVISAKGSGTGGGITSGFDQLATNNAYLSIGDVDLDLENDILMVTSHDDQNNLQYMTVTVFGMNPSLSTMTTKGSKSNLQQANFSGFSSNYRFAAAFGEFSGGRGILKAPSRSTRKILTPLIVNNSPPYHYDIFGTDTADLTSCFASSPGSFQCNQSSEYKAVVTQSSTVETTLKSDWGVSGTLSAGGSVLGVGLKASVTAKYGEAFSNTQGTTDTKSVTTLSTAKGDDQIYGVISNFDVYEYPVDSSGVTIGYVLAMMRASTPIYQFMDSKSGDAYTYVPDHEVGNLMSYPSANDFNNLAGNLASIQTGTGLNVGNGGSLNFTMTHANFANSNVSDTRTFGLEVNASASYYGVGLDVSGSYNSSEMTTHTSTASQEVSYISNLTANLNPRYSDANYTLVPYVYWAKNGAIALGYSVDPTISSGNNFWKDRYTGKPDLTVIMPWKYDREKGYSLGNTPDKQRLCKSIFFNKTSFITGDTVLITAFIHNYSFLDYSGPVQFRFYAGNPDNPDNILLSDIDGQTTLSVTDMFKARGRTAIQFKWKVPVGVNSGASIYMVIDPNNQISEVHEDNNVGFAFVGSGGVNAIEDEKPMASFEAEIFPNPASDGMTQLQLQLAAAGKLKVDLYDLQGRLLTSIYNDELSSGKFLLPVSTANYAPGFYLLHINFNGQEQTIRLANIR